MLKLILLLAILPMIFVPAFSDEVIIQPVYPSTGFSLCVNAEYGTDIITVTGKTVSDLTDVTFRVTSPSGNNVVAIDQVTPDDNGDFVTEFKISSLWTENGFYTITAKQSIQQNSLYSLKVLVEVNNGQTEEAELCINSPPPKITINPVNGSGDHNHECVNIEYGCFNPGTTLVNYGQIIIFSNTDSAAHTFTSGEATDADSVGAIFDSSLAMAGSSFEWAANVTGEIPYFCIIHPWMDGIIIVNNQILEEKLILTQKQLIAINYEITHFEMKINNLQTTIDSQQIRLDKATLENVTQRIDKLTTNIEGMIALQYIYESLIILTQNQIILYS